MLGQLMEGKLWDYLCEHWNHLKDADIWLKRESGNLDGALWSLAQSLSAIMIKTGMRRNSNSTQGYISTDGRVPFLIASEKPLGKKVFTFTKTVKDLWIMWKDCRKTICLHWYLWLDTTHKPAPKHKLATEFPMSSVSLHKKEKWEKKCTA